MIAKVPQVRAGKIAGVDAGRVARARGDVVEVADRFGLSPAEVLSARVWWEKRQGKAKKRAAARRKKDSPAAWTRKLDKLCREVVRARGVCQLRGVDHLTCDTFALQWMHGESRRHFRTRWEPETHLLGCQTHHKFYTENPLLWAELLMEKFPAVWATLKMLRTFEVPKGAARVVWLQQIEKRLEGMRG